jgi:hypothetical protein
LGRKIFVKAIDKTGNEQVSEITLPPKPFPYWIIIPIIISLIVVWWIIRRLKIRSQKSK